MADSLISANNPGSTTRGRVCPLRVLGKGYSLTQGSYDIWHQTPAPPPLYVTHILLFASVTDFWVFHSWGFKLPPLSKEIIWLGPNASTCSWHSLPMRRSLLLLKRHMTTLVLFVGHMMKCALRWMALLLGCSAQCHLQSNNISSICKWGAAGDVYYIHWGTLNGANSPLDRLHDGLPICNGTYPLAYINPKLPFEWGLRELMAGFCLI